MLELIFGSSCIRSIIDYAVPVRFFSTVCPAKYFMQELEPVQKRAMSIICPCQSYREALDIINLKKLAIDHDEIRKTLFDTIVNDNSHRLN